MLGRSSFVGGPGIMNNDFYGKNGNNKRHADFGVRVWKNNQPSMRLP